MGENGVNMLDKIIKLMGSSDISIDIGREASLVIAFLINYGKGKDIKELVEKNVIRLFVQVIEKSFYLNNQN